MKVVIVGGYGVFGSLIARLLTRDGHRIWIAGRHPHRGRKLSAEIGAQALRVDIAVAPEALFHLRPDVVIDAAGPYQTYGNDPYRLARLCVENGCHYLDLSDSSDFTRGIGVLNEAAEAAGVFVLSGASSVPGLSSIIAADLADGLDEVDAIDMAILPGNRAPRGMSVIKSIVSGVGRPSRVFRDGAWQMVRGWTDRKVFELEPGLKRAGYFVDVPDIALLPAFTGARSVMFRAGLELRVMNAALSVLSKLRQKWKLELPEAVLAALYALSKALYPLGTDRGGMLVAVTGQLEGRRICRRWTLIAEKGHGPFVPGVVCRAILQTHASIKPGARPCLAEISGDAVTRAMNDLAIRTKTSTACESQPVNDALSSRANQTAFKKRSSQRNPGTVF